MQPNKNNKSLTIILTNLKMHELQFIFNGIHNDAAEPWQMGFQDSASPLFSGLVELHNKIGFFLIVISLSVF
jgi:hypothetical protein